MGKTRNLNGDDIINIILEDKRTAVNIAGKIYKYFVNEKEDAEIINSLAEDFFRSDYNVEKLMKNIFTSDWFYNDENIGTRIKSPVDLLAGMMRSCNIKFKNHIALIGIQKILGQMLLNPPNVSGWPSGTKWIDTSSIMFRMKLPEIVFKSSEIEFDFKDETAGDMDNEMILEMSKVDKKLYKQVKTSIDLRDYYKVFSGQGTEASVDSLSKFVLQPEITQKEKELITKYADTTSGDNLVESVLMKLMSLPEYQMC